MLESDLYWNSARTMVAVESSLQSTMLKLAREAEKSEEAQKATPSEGPRPLHRKWPAGQEPTHWALE